MESMFHFPLESLLSHRKFVEDSLQKELAEVNRNLVEEQRRLDEIQTQILQMDDAFRDKFRDDSSAEEMDQYNQYFRCLVVASRGQQRRVNEVEKRVDQKRRNLLEAMKRRKMLDKLKDRRWQEYRQEENRLEREFVDEVAIGQYNRKPAVV